MDPKIVGTTLPVLEMTLDPGDKIVAETGQLSWMTDSIELQTLTVPNLAHALTPYITSESASDSIGGVAGAAITGSVAGAVLNGIFGRDDET